MADNSVAVLADWARKFGLELTVEKDDKKTCWGFYKGKQPLFRTYQTSAAKAYLSGFEDCRYVEQKKYSN